MGSTPVLGPVLSIDAEVAAATMGRVGTPIKPPSQASASSK
ncbi:hypothetical protein [Nocardia rhizosphaerihabitans]|nr:hypothetical protein [Nocardia rhizosphaerihabitans]